ncbi:MAG: 3-hydroxyisobutyrate dehydrogenase [Hyphomicrobiales bacterium]|nr:MAG: 3-hydroxyisobutyrate dehydrogenase [Hyphomicrobiales bacterium]
MPGADQDAITKLAFIGFGEAGQAFVQGFGRRWSGIAWAFDIKTDDTRAEVRDGKWADYRRAGVTGCVAPADALTQAEVIFSVVTADQALSAAESAARHIAPGALYFDCNSCSPGTKRRAAAAISKAGGFYVDTAVMGPVHPHLNKVPLLIAGDQTEQAVQALTALEMNGEIVDGAAGAASAIKMTRSIMMKGLEALFVECVLAGRSAGVDEVVLDSLEVTFPGFEFKTKAAYMLERVMTHGLRRAAEMREVAVTVEELGLPGRMAGASTEWQQQIGDLGLAAEGHDYRAMADALLAQLGRKEDTA